MFRHRPLSLTLSLIAAFIIAACCVLWGAPVRAQANGYTYDIDSWGIPRFVNTVYIDLAKITKLSRFRSNAGHDYSDSTQFGISGYKGGPGNRIEAVPQ